MFAAFFFFFFFFFMAATMTSSTTASMPAHFHNIAPYGRNRESVPVQPISLNFSDFRHQ